MISVVEGKGEQMADLIDRQVVQEMVDRIGDIYPYRQIGNRDSYSQYNEAWTDAINRVDAELNSLPSAQPETDGFCTDCKEYDSERHFCPRFDRVIKKTVEEMGNIRCGECKHWKNDHLCEVLSRFGTFETEVYFYCGFAERREE